MIKKIFLAILALVFGSPALAEDPSEGKRGKNQADHASDTAKEKANDKSAVKDHVPTGSDEPLPPPEGGWILPES